MAASTGIGLYIGEEQIRAVKLRRSGRGVVLQALGSVATPPGAMSGGVVLDAKLLADAIRRLLRGYDITGNSAVVALPARTATSRVLELPKMNVEDLRTVVAGEMEHYRMIPPGQGTFDFIPLGEVVSGEQVRLRLLLIAADKRIVDSYREALRLAGLQLEALEPFSLAAARAAYPALGSGGVALVAVSARGTELSIFDSGMLRYSRQIDTGSMDLIRGSSSVRLEAAAGGDPQQAPPEQQPDLLARANAGGLQTLQFEIQRSFDFYHRESPEAAQVERILLCADSDQLQGLEAYLAENLGLPVAACEPFRGLHFAESQFNPDFLARVGSAFAPAVGLALRALEEVPEAPGMDLSLTGRESILEKVAPRRLVWALALSILLVLAAVIGAWQLHRALQQREQELAATQARLAEIARTEEEQTRAARRVQEAQAIVQLGGLPWSDILFQVAEFMPQRSWLTNLSSDSTNSLSLEGGAMSADSVATLMDSLARSPLFSMPRMTSIQKDPSKSQPTVKFQIKVSVSQPAAIAVAPAHPGPAVPAGGAQ